MVYLIYSKKKNDKTDHYKLIGQTADKDYHDEIIRQLVKGIFHDVLDILEMQQHYFQNIKTKL
jgi:hypothetical protein